MDKAPLPGSLHGLSVCLCRLPSAVSPSVRPFIPDRTRESKQNHSDPGHKPTRPHVPTSWPRDSVRHEEATSISPPS